MEKKNVVEAEMELWTYSEMEIVVVSTYEFNIRGCRKIGKNMEVEEKVL